FWLVLFYTVTRLPPRNSAAGIQPRLTAIAGTFFMIVVGAVPTGPVSASTTVASSALIVLGTVASIYCISWLGRAFSIMATAPGLVMEGPYRVVRHPLYVAEAITMIGIVISKWSIAAVVAGGVSCLLQLRRMFNEERVLRATFPEYEMYAERVPMFLPGWSR